MPGERQLLLVRAALATGDEARQAWEEWRTTAEYGRSDPASDVLLPIVYRNLQGDERTDPTLGRARLAYQTTWATNERHLYETAKVLRALQEAGIETMLLKGAALALEHYRDLGCRSLGDIDLLVRPEQLRDAHELLLASGFRTLGRPRTTLTDAYLSWEKALNLTSEKITKLDLHWRVLREVRSPDEEEAFWAAAQKITLHGLGTCVMNAPDQILHVCAHEARWCPSPLPRWMADLAMVFRTSGDALDTNRLLHRAQCLGLVSPVVEMLVSLDAAVPGVVPRRLLEAVHEVSTTPEERREYEARCRRPSSFTVLREEYQVHREQTRGLGAIRRLLSFPAYVRDQLGLKRSWQLIPALAAWCWRSRRGGLGSRGRERQQPF